MVQQLGHQSPVVAISCCTLPLSGVGLHAATLERQDGEPRELLNKTDVGQEDGTQGPGKALTCVLVLLARALHQRLVRPVKNSQPDGLLAVEMLEYAPLGDAGMTKARSPVVISGWAALSGQSQGRLDQFCLAASVLSPIRVLATII